MKRLYAVLMFLVLVLLLAVPVQAQEALEMPPVLKEQLGLEPGCTVIGSTQVWATETCTLNCGKMHPNKAAVWYKKKMTPGNGFVDAILDWYDGGTRAMAKKEGATLVAQANKVEGYTQLVLSVDNIEALGGTPVDPNAQVEEAQAEAEAAAGTADGTAGGDPGQVLEQAGTSPDAKEATGPVTEEGAGLSSEIWEIVPLRSGDTLVEEFMTNGNPGCGVASQASVDEVLDYYANALVAKGWMNAARYEAEDGGMVTLLKGEDTFIVACDGDVASGVEYNLFLNKGQ